MAFPQDVLDLKAELSLNGTWTDVTSYVQRRDSLVQITRGRSDEAAQVERSSCRCTLDNRDGRFSPRLPTGAYYGTIGRNTQLRVSVPDTTHLLLAVGDSGDTASCPDAAALGITGDIDIRYDATLMSWRIWQNLAGKWESTGSQRSWGLQTLEGGYLRLAWSTDGTSLTIITAVSTIPVPAHKGRLAVRATLDVNNGASGNTATFYTSDSISGSWTQLGDAVVTSGTTSIFDGTGAVEVGEVEDLGNLVADGDTAMTFVGILGRVHGFQLRDGIGGTVVANPDFTAQTAGAASFADTASSPNTWTMNGSAALSDRDYRMHGEVSAWPTRWDPSGSDVYTQVEASGILRRLTQGASPLNSVMYRGMVTLTVDEPVAYWPCEDTDGASVLASGLPDGRPMTLIGTPTLASSTDFVASSPLPVVANSTWTGPVPAYTNTGDTQLRFLLAVPAGGLTNNAVVARLATSGTCRRFDVVYTTASSGGLALKGYDVDGTELFASTPMTGYDGALLRLSVELTEDAGDIDWNFLVTQVGVEPTLNELGTLTTDTVGVVKTVTIGPDANVDGAAVGHISLHDAITDIDTLDEELTGYDGETAGRRVERLCSEEGIVFRWAGDLDDTEAMGPQGVAALATLLTECADADGGMLYEPREVFGLGYRPRTSLYSQDAAVTLDYSAGELFGELAPTDDDLATRNDITVTRTGGSSARAELTSGALSTAAPPNGVGRYDEAVTLNLATDDRLSDHAYWRLHLGTVDEERYPQVTVNLANERIAADTALTASVRGTDLGDRLVIENPPAWLPPDDVQQLIQGATETLGNYEHDIAFVCSPASPWTVAFVDEARVDTDGSDLGTGVDSDDTSLSVDVTAGSLWTTSDTPFDVRMGGEVITVTAVSGASSPQTMTVTRSANGVTKSHLAGADVRLAAPAIVAL